MISRRRSRSGSGRSRNSTRLASSGGISIAGAVRTSVRRLAENFWPTSRRRRTTTGLSMWRWKSFSTKTASMVMVSRLASACTGSAVLYMAVFGLARGIGTDRREHGSRQAIGFAVALRDRASSCRRAMATGCGAATPLPERTRPSAMVHSKTARFRSEQAARTSDKRADFLDRLHHDDGGGGVDENLQAVERVWAGLRANSYLFDPVRLAPVEY